AILTNMFHVKRSRKDFMGSSRMQKNVSPDNQFVVDLLTTLKREHFSPSGWWHFLAHSWNMSCATANKHPELKRSWLHITLLFGVLAGILLLITFLSSGTSALLHLLPGLVFCVAWQQSDLFWHLGLNRRVETGELLPHVGIANILTGLRGLAASYLLSRLIGGLATPSALALLVFLCGILTDILDGLWARRARTQSRLGQIMDGEADFCLYLALTFILVQNGVLPLWLGILMLLRFCVPLLAALASYFLLAKPVRFGSTLWGKGAGIAQCLYFLLLLAPSQLTPLTHALNLPLLLITLALLIAAPSAQIVGNVAQRAQ
ncbi:MAG TPA: CDP-alcohol phosphatidyltransferase family protein, partial [Ktedonobacteraceae bacterium]|nr:CDP-alcohol phosphatidyltransferase family protein [Ktedonobacteraceae bacterium]